MDNVEAVEVAKGGYDLLCDLDRLVLLRGWRGREGEGERRRVREREIVRLYEEAADGGVNEAMTRLGWMLEEGECVCMSV